MSIPCRVMADLARHEAELRDHIPEAFDEYDDMHVRAVVPYELAESIQGLLLWRRALRTLPETDQEILKYLDQLYRGCVERWRDI